MPTFESSISIAAPPEVVWRVLSNVVAWPQWLPTVSKVEPLDGAPLSQGARYLVHQPKLRPTIWSVTELAAPQRFVWVARSPGVRMVAEHTVTGQDNAVSVQLRFSFFGLLGGVVALLFGSLTQRYLAQEVAALKQQVETAR